MARYAANTEVSSYRSREEIERTLTRYGASKFMYGWEESRALIGFHMHDRLIRFILPMPAREDFMYTPARGTLRSDAAIDAAWEQAQRQRWRALALVIKAKLEAVKSGIVEFEQEFLANMILDDGTTVGERIVPHLDRITRGGQLLPLLPSGHESGTP